MLFQNCQTMPLRLGLWPKESIMSMRAPTSTEIQMCVFTIQAGSNLGRECMAQLDVTANTVLPAITLTDSCGNLCHGNSDGHSSLQTWPVWKKLKGQENMKQRARTSQQANKHPRRLLKLCGRRTCPVTQENIKSTRGDVYFCQHC